MNNRINIINSEIQKAVSEIITYEIKNPKITGIISVVKVETTSDLEFCKIYLSVYTNDDRQEVFNQVKHSAGFIRKELTKKVDIRKTPFLQFYLDNSIEINNQINNLIAKVNENKKGTENENQ
jgi:ribosome-binding factor A